MNKNIIDNTVYHQYRYNQLYGKGVYLAHKEGNLYPLGFKIHFLLRFYCLFTLHVTLDITIPLVLRYIWRLNPYRTKEFCLYVDTGAGYEIYGMIM